EQRRAHLGREFFGPDDVLDAERHAVEGGALLARAPALTRRVRRSPRSIQIGDHKSANLRLPLGVPFETGLEKFARAVLAGGKAAGGLQIGSYAGCAHAASNVMDAMRRCDAIMEVRSRNCLARVGSAAMARSSSRLRLRVSASFASSRFLFSIDCCCTNSVATVRRCRL